MARIAWANRDNLSYAWRILRRGVCDGCSLGPDGLKDSTLSGVHLCLTRLRMLRLNTMPSLDPALLQSASSLAGRSGEELRDLGRLSYPMIRRAGQPGFSRISWDEAFTTAAPYLKRDPRRVAFYTTSRGLTNEVYYAAQKFARLLGTNHIDNAARLCHAASTVALKQTLGVGASTCSYSDWLGADLILLYGTDLANNQPVSLKYLYHAKRRGARILVVNPYREPGLERYWIPSIAGSALFGTEIADEFFSLRAGGDIAFNLGVLKHLCVSGSLDRPFIEEHTSGFEALREQAQALSWNELESSSGTARASMEHFADLYAGSRESVFIWSMGLTQHRFGVQNVKSVINLALARGNIGRPNCGLVPIRGHSGVQGASECGAAPGEFPGGVPVGESSAADFSRRWGALVPEWRGMNVPEMLEAAAGGRLDCFYIVGGNFVDTMPEPDRVAAALSRIPCRIHQDLTLNSSMLLDPGEVVLLFPARTRYEQEGGGTVTSTERRIRYTPEIPGPRIGEARSEWEIFRDLAPYALDAARARAMAFADAAALRREMDEVIPLYRGIGGLESRGDQFQYGGPRLLDGGVCPAMPDGKARFSVVEPPRLVEGANLFYLTTRRGTQFNSMVYGEKDWLTGAARDIVLISAADAHGLGIDEGARILLRAGGRQTVARCKIADIHPGTLQGFWPEMNILISARSDPASGEPDYNALVEVEPI